jgi:hypothetical protein
MPFLVLFGLKDISGSVPPADLKRASSDAGVDLAMVIVFFTSPDLTLYFFRVCWAALARPEVTALFNALDIARPRSLADKDLFALFRSRTAWRTSTRIIFLNKSIKIIDQKLD